MAICTLNLIMILEKSRKHYKQSGIVSLVQRYTPIFQASGEAEAGGLLELRSLGPAWATEQDSIT